MVKYPGMDPPMMPGWVFFPVKHGIYGIALRSGGGNIGKTMSKLVVVRIILKTNAYYYDNICHPISARNHMKSLYLLHNNIT